MVLVFSQRSARGRGSQEPHRIEQCFAPTRSEVRFDSMCTPTRLASSDRVPLSNQQLLKPTTKRRLGSPAPDLVC